MAEGERIKEDKMVIDINLPQDRDSQIKFALAFYPLFGQKRPPVCDICGGIKDPKQAKTRRCLCQEYKEEPGQS